jgi:hypothetical protein
MAFSTGKTLGFYSNERWKMSNQMFEIGKEYLVTMLVAEDGELVEEVTNWNVAAVQGTLVKLTSPLAPDKIINTASRRFVSAQLSKHHQAR